jgi:hypothetical protein
MAFFPHEPLRRLSLAFGVPGTGGRQLWKGFSGEQENSVWASRSHLVVRVWDCDRLGGDFVRRGSPASKSLVSLVQLYFMSTYLDISVGGRDEK